MKKIILTTFAIFIAAIQLCFAQVPQGMSYQAVARDAGGIILSNQNICIQSAITDGSGGAVAYKETFNINTNQLGLFTLKIGTGTPVSGTFSGINWSGITAWHQLEIKIGCTGNYVLMGSSQLMSVPYALVADSTRKSPPPDFSSKSLNNSVGSTLRNTNIETNDSILIDKTGYYLVVLTAEGYDDNQSTGSNQDQSGLVSIYNNGGQITGGYPFVKKYKDDGYTQTMFRFIPANVYVTKVLLLNAGDVLRGAGGVFGTGTQTDNWGVSIIIDIFKLQ
jgi:hypothetical protein